MGKVWVLFPKYGDKPDRVKAPTTPISPTDFLKGSVIKTDDTYGKEVWVIGSGYRRIEVEDE